MADNSPTSLHRLLGIPERGADPASADPETQASQGATVGSARIQEALMLADGYRKNTVSNPRACGYQSRMTDTRPKEDRSLGDLTKQLSRDITALVRSEVALAKAEVTERASVMARGAALVAVGVVFALIVVSCLVAAGVAALSLVVDVWLAAVIVAGIAGVVAAVMAMAGIKALRSAGPPLPLDTVESAKEDVAWVKTHAKSGAK